MFSLAVVRCSWVGIGSVAVYYDCHRPQAMMEVACGVVGRQLQLDLRQGSCCRDRFQIKNTRQLEPAGRFCMTMILELNARWFTIFEARTF